jgi:Family of unknown function (DUF6152)
LLAAHDTKKPVSLKGTPNRGTIGSARASIHMQFKDEAGTGNERATASLGENLVMRNGWRKETAKPGDGICLGVCISGGRTLS